MQKSLLSSKILKYKKNTYFNEGTYNGKQKFEYNFNNSLINSDDVFINNSFSSMGE